MGGIVTGAIAGAITLTLWLLEVTTGWWLALIFVAAWVVLYGLYRMAKSGAFGDGVADFADFGDSGGCGSGGGSSCGGGGGGD